NRLNTGDTVTFTDVDGNQFTYAVSLIEDLPGTAIEEMQAGEWDLTLFTCTLGGRSRVTVRCERTADS
ncbi:MAG TPA: sortase, partial [Candidatus Agathobaculum pullistercoris]|nr:sortase [Candidatus Agathobaculum pullistercoris]